MDRDIMDNVSFLLFLFVTSTNCLFSGKINRIMLSLYSLIKKACMFFLEYVVILDIFGIHLTSVQCVITVIGTVIVYDPLNLLYPNQRAIQISLFNRRISTLVFWVRYSHKLVFN